MAGLVPAIHVFVARKITAFGTRPADQVRGLRSLRSLGLLHQFRCRHRPRKRTIQYSPRDRCLLDAPPARGMTMMELRSVLRRPGGHSEEPIPDPIPNSAVKVLCADGTKPQGLEE